MAPLCLFSVRARPGGLYQSVEIRVSIKRSGTIHHDTVSIRPLDANPTTIALAALPAARGPSGKPGARPFASMYVKLVSAVDSRGNESVTGKKTADIFKPDFVDRPADEFVVRWGQYWNTQEIDAYKHEIRNRVFSRVVKPAGQLWRPLTLRRTLFRLLVSEPALALAFWSQNLIRAKGISQQVHAAGGASVDERGSVTRGGDLQQGFAKG